MWTDENRGRTDRSELRYPSDLTDHERTLVEPEIPRARRGGKPKKGVRIDRPGFDGTKKIKGKKRHVLVDTQSPLMEALVQAADIQDRDGGVLPVACCRWRACSACIGSCSSSTPTRATRGRSSGRDRPGSAAT